MLRKVLTKVIGDPNEREIRRHQEIVDEINALEPAVQRLSDVELRAKTGEFCARRQAGATTDELLPEAYAVVREASRRTIGLRPYDVQLIGGIVLHQGKIAEMKTGEGKTLVATLPLYLNALEGRGAHLITPNDYLSKFGVQWMGPIYHLLGVSVGVIQASAQDPNKGSFMFDPAFVSDDERYQHLRPVPRREAYLADITYGTNNEFGFDYLRDNMVFEKHQMVQRELYYGIVDEVDNILIDEARTPLIISGPAEQPSPYYRLFAKMVRHLEPSSAASVEREEPDGDYVLDEKMRNVTLTEKGVEKIEALLRHEIGQDISSLYDPEYSELIPYLDNALRAQVTYQRDKDYIVENGQVVIVDEFTGRLMYGRRYSEGLHQSIEAKEGVEVRRENLTLATITFQNYFRMYKKLAGMTGTAATEREEFEKTYNLDVTVIPTHEPVIRADREDLVYLSEKAKFDAVVEEIKGLCEAGRPVLVGTASIETSERLSRQLERGGVPHQVLNAKYHEREAGIIAQAGRPGAVTIATNMAGRGVDILLGGNPEGLAREKLRRQGIELTQATPEQWEAAFAEAQAECAEDRERVIAAGGLHILGTERHEARRIDNQLRGRSGRQGDPGSSQFYLSLEDELMRRFGGERIKNLMNGTLGRIAADGIDPNVPITHNWVSRSIAQAQTRVEGYHFDIRKRLLEYDDVINKQREVIYKQRREVLELPNLRDQILRMVREEIEALVETHLASEDPEEWNLVTLHHDALKVFPVPRTITPDAWADLDRDAIMAQLVQASEAVYAAREAQFADERVGDVPFMRYVERWVILRVVDNLWVHHLTDLDVLREGIGLQAYGHRDPLVEFKREAHAMWEQLLGQIQRRVVELVYHVEPQKQQPQQRVMQYQTNQGNGRKDAATVRADQWANVGRNDPCPCGSGKKFKHCHYREIQKQRQTVDQDEIKRTGKRRR